METKPASKRQLACIRRLQMVMGEDEPEISEEMSVSEASNLISELISRARQNGVVVQRQVNEPRLGMAMKECFSPVDRPRKEHP
jgi:DNA-binding transcriptional regulator LsrR (DeoR family)